MSSFNRNFTSESSQLQEKQTKHLLIFNTVHGDSHHVEGGSR